MKVYFKLNLKNYIIYTNKWVIINNDPFISREDFQQLNKYLKYYPNGSRV